jgi:hypothetical protein
METPFASADAFLDSNSFRNLSNILAQNRLFPNMACFP